MIFIIILNLIWFFLHTNTIYHFYRIYRRFSAFRASKLNPFHFFHKIHYTHKKCKAIFRFLRPYFINSRHLGDKYLGREVVCEESPGGTAPPSPGALVPTLETAIFYYNANIWFAQNFESFIIIIKHCSAGSRSAATRSASLKLLWRVFRTVELFHPAKLLPRRLEVRMLPHCWVDVVNLFCK